MAKIIQFKSKELIQAEKEDAKDISIRAIKKALLIMRGYQEHKEIKKASEMVKSALDSLGDIDG